MVLIRLPYTNAITVNTRGMAGMAASSCTPTCATKAARARTKEEAKQEKAAKQEKERARAANRVRSKCHGINGHSERTMKKLLIRIFDPQLHVQDSLVARMIQETIGLSIFLMIVLCSVSPIAVLWLRLSVSRS